MKGMKAHGLFFAVNDCLFALNDAEGCLLRCNWKDNPRIKSLYQRLRAIHIDLEDIQDEALKHIQDYD